MHEPVVATEVVHRLGEGPAWDPIRQRLYWVDIFGGLVYFGRVTEVGLIEVEGQIDFPDLARTVAIAECGELVVGGRARLFLRDASGTIHAGARVLPEGSGRRLNDGKPDPRGRMLIGTMSIDRESDSEALVRIEHGGAITALDDDLTLSNGMAWSRDGALFYNVDSMSRRIFVRNYDPDTGAIGPRSTLVEVEQGLPDGMCLDSEGCLWVAIWGPGQVNRYSPDGRLIDVIDVPAPHTSCVAFAGPELERLVVTTATNDLDFEQLASHPLSGRLFTVSPGVRGAPSPLWAGTSVDKGK